MPDAGLAFDGVNAALRLPGAQRIIDALPAARTDRDGLCRAMRQLSEDPATHHRVEEIRAIVVRETGATTEEFNRVALLTMAAASLPALDSMPVPAAVKERTKALFERFATLDEGGRINTTGGPANRFVQFAKIAALRRWPAGLFDWEESGLPRSWLPRIRPLGALARIASLLAQRWHGFRPAFFAHLTICRPVHALTPRETLQSYRLIAEALALQPGVKGMVTASWFHSPDTFAVTPHLAWLNDVFLRHGGLVATIGAADPDCGVFFRSPDRRRAFDEGRFRPTIGLIVWPREEMIAWATRHQEL